jgi:hypothetical protein
MKSISEPFLRRPVLTLVISLLILLAGLLLLAAPGYFDKVPAGHAVGRTSP